jgi:lipopolysaccharide transport system ATP-binding protein
MASPIIKVENLSKQFIIDHEGQERYTALRDVIARKTKKLFSFPATAEKKKAKTIKENFWALQDINFEIQAGERLGIIGRNGAGKSTLLKILSRITDPTSGRISLSGRVASLLEVGTGFHPELTGRENVFLNGAILGMSRSEIKKKFDEIVDFAEVEKFLDTPVKRYSSGMYVRLAFAVAAHLEPEILIVDEVLAVGDAEFQKKCLGRMKDVSGQGRTVLFVSHNMTAIKNLCEKIVYLNKGRVQEIGEANTVINSYLSHNANSDIRRVYATEHEAPGNELVKIRRIEGRPLLSSPGDPITVSTDIDIEFEFWNNLTDKCINLSMHLYTLADECVFNVGTSAKMLSAGIHKAVCRIPGNLLNDGIYTISMMIVAERSYAIYNFEKAIAFEVNENRDISGWHGKWPGFVRPTLKFTLD